MTDVHKRRRTTAALILSLVLIVVGISSQIQENYQIQQHNKKVRTNTTEQPLAVDALAKLDIKGRAPKTGYSRDIFGGGWRSTDDCNTRDEILARDLSQTEIKDCKVYSGVLDDPYTGKRIEFARGPDTSDDVQIDHVVALSDAWQKGAQYLSYQTRENLANDPLELLAVDGEANQQKGDGDAATWLPPNKPYRCRYVARQIAVKQKYDLWITSAEYDAMQRILSKCPEQELPAVGR